MNKFDLSYDLSYNYGSYIAKTSFICGNEFIMNPLNLKETIVNISHEKINIGSSIVEPSIKFILNPDQSGVDLELEIKNKNIPN